MLYPKISVITPSYNQGKYLEATIRSVLSQNYPNLEYIIMDGGSTDESVAIIQQFADQLDYWVSERDRGQTHAINKGFERASGEIMGWLNSDDILQPGALLAIGEAFAKNPKLKVATGFRTLIDKDGQFMTNWVRGLPTDDHVRHRNVVAQECTYWRREVWEKIGKLDESHRFGMDYEYWQRMIANGYHITMLPHHLGSIRIHEEAKSSTLHDVYQSELALILQKYGVANSEAEAVAQLGQLWDWRYRLIKDLCMGSAFNSAQRGLWLLRFLHSPVAIPILAAYGLYRRFRPR